MKQLVLEKEVDSDTDIMNPEQQPSTPKKAARYGTFKPSYSPSRLKFRYTVIEKPKSSPFGIILILSWVLIIGMLLYSSYHNKLKTLQNQTAEEQIQCRIDYEKNKCEKGLKATVSYCEEKRKCFQSQPQTYYQGKINNSFIAGEIIRSFAEGAGLYVCAGGLVMIWILIRKQPAKEIRKEYEQYFQ